MTVRRMIHRSLAPLLSLAALAALGGCVALDNYPAKGDARPHPGVAEAHRYPIHGIDISRWQGDIDWASVKAAGTRFVFMKATEGGDHVDPAFQRNWEGARRAGIPRGAYHFVYWCRPAHEQALWFKQQIPNDRDALPPVLDVEWNGDSKTCPKKIDPDLAREKIQLMLTELEQLTGKRPIIYTDITFHKDVLEGHFNDYPYWLRSTAAPVRHRYSREKWEFWQFTTTGRVPGIRGNVDRNAFFGTETEFAGWMQGRYEIAGRNWDSDKEKAAPGPRQPGPLPERPAMPNPSAVATLPPASTAYAPTARPDDEAGTE